MPTPIDHSLLGLIAYRASIRSRRKLLPGGRGMDLQAVLGMELLVFMCCGCHLLMDFSRKDVAPQNGFGIPILHRLSVGESFSVSAWKVV